MPVMPYDLWKRIKSSDRTGSSPLCFVESFTKLTNGNITPAGTPIGPASESPGVKKAFISDIHGNLEALVAVLADIRSQNITDIYCLGDVVGYGPNPRECIDLITNFKLVLLGNHDQGAMFDPDGFNAAAERAIFWTRSQLESGNESRADREKRWEFLAERPRSFKEDKLLFVHGSARNPLNEYVFPEDIYNQRKMERIFALVDKYCFQGHTHVPGVFTETMQFLSPEDMDHSYTLEDRKTLCNVGSVGQPRDGNRKACYVVLDDNVINFRRVDYDWTQTRDKIYAIPDLDNFLGDRLG